MINVILENPYTKCGGKASPTPSFEKSKLDISQDKQFQILYSLLLLYALVEDHQNILRLRC